MEMDEKLYRAFLEQMYELETFRMEYASRHPSAPLDRDDPDVKRLVEALAFFSAPDPHGRCRQYRGLTAPDFSTVFFHFYYPRCP